MIKIAYVMIVAYYSGGQLYMTEIDYLDTKAQCESYASSQIEIHRTAGIPIEHLNSICIQVVVPSR